MPKLNIKKLKKLYKGNALYYKQIHELLYFPN